MSAAALDQFRGAMAAAGLTPPDDLHDDGQLHRFPTNGRRGDDSGWYVLHGDDIPAGAFGCWREGVTQSWCSKSDEVMTASERESYRQRVHAIRAQREADAADRHRQASATATTRWASTATCDGHPYLVAKRVKAYGARLEGDTLVVPLRDTAGTLHSLQLIDPAGGKRFLPGGRVSGCYFSMGKPTGTFIVCEGFATGATVHEATGQAVAVAFNAGNLKAVAESLRAKLPELRLILAADDDWRTDGNPGISKATEAARAVGGWLAVPRFPETRGEKDTDYNDLAKLMGPGAVRACINAAVKVEPTTAESQAWPDPSPLPNELPKVAQFDMALLPEALRGWVADIAERMQCPPDFSAVGAVVALSGLIGARAVVAPKARDDWRVVPNLWGLIVGRPGVMKSPALAQVLAPLQRLEATERELWQAAHDSWELDCKVAELAGKASEKEAMKVASKDPAKARALLQPTDTPAEPTMRRYLVNDATVEKLADLLVTNPWGLTVYRDEIHGLLCSMDRQGQEGARGFYLTGYDGNQGHAVDRIGRGESYVPRVCLAMLGGIQPGKVQSYVRDAVAGGAGDDGLLQRFGLAVWPDIDAGYDHVERWPDTAAKQKAWSVFERLNQLQPATDTEPQEWRFSPAAQELYREWIIPFETEIRGDELHPALVSHLAKYRKLIPALALIFALVDTPDSGNVIHEAELIRAMAWGDYLRSHAERLYSAAVIPETAGAHALLAKIKAGKLHDSEGVLLDAFEPWRVSTKGWARLTSPDEVRKAANVLADYGWLAREVTAPSARGGRPGERFLIHPMLLGGAQ
jgi:putative DNA primase/helicase